MLSVTMLVVSACPLSCVLLFQVYMATLMRQKMARARRVGGARTYMCLSKFEVRGNGAERRRLVQTECWCPRDVLDGKPCGVLV